MAENNYLDDFINSVKNDTFNVFNEGAFKQIKNSINQWLLIKDKLDRRLAIQYKKFEKENQIKKLDSEYKISSSDLRQLIDTYSEQKRKIREIHNLEDIKDHLKKGYELIHYLREVLTGQEIKYSILYRAPNAKDTDPLLEVPLTLEQLIPQVKISIDSINATKNKDELSKALHLSINSSGVQKIIQDNEKELNQLITILDKPKLWDSLVAYRDAHFNPAGANFGRLYEVYYNMRRDSRYQNINYIGKNGSKNTEGLADKMIRTVMKDKVPGWKTGDYELTQLKSVFNSAAGLINAGSITKILTNIKNILEKENNKNKIANTLKEIFTPFEGQLNSEIDKKNKELAEQSIDNIVKALKLDK